MNDMMVMANAILPFILMAAIFYFMLWRPQKQEQKKRKELLDSLKRGDKIITIGGIYGTLTKVGPMKVKVRLAEGIEIEMARTAISGFQDAPSCGAKPKKRLNRSRNFSFSSLVGGWFRYGSSLVRCSTMWC